MLSRPVPSTSSPSEGDALWLTGQLRASRLTVLCGDADDAMTRLLREGVLPRLQRRAEDRREARAPGRDMPLPFVDRRAARGLPAEVGVYFDGWGESPRQGLTRALRDAVLARGADPEAGRDLPLRLADKLMALSQGSALRFVIVLDHFDICLGAAPDRADLHALREEIFEAINLPKVPAQFLLALREDAEPLAERLRGCILGFDALRQPLPSGAASDDRERVGASPSLASLQPPQRVLPEKTAAVYASIESWLERAVQREADAASAPPVSAKVPDVAGELAIAARIAADAEAKRAAEQAASAHAAAVAAEAQRLAAAQAAVERAETERLAAERAAAEAADARRLAAVRAAAEQAAAERAATEQAAMRQAEALRLAAAQAAADRAETERVAADQAVAHAAEARSRAAQEQAAAEQAAEARRVAVAQAAARQTVAERVEASSAEAPESVDVELPLAPEQRAEVPPIVVAGLDLRPAPHASRDDSDPADEEGLSDDDFAGSDNPGAVPPPRHRRGRAERTRWIGGLSALAAVMVAGLWWLNEHTGRDADLASALENLPPTAAGTAAAPWLKLGAGDLLTAGMGDDLRRALAASGGLELQPSRGWRQDLERLRDGAQVAVVRHDALQAARADSADGGLRIVMPLVAQELAFVVRADSPLRHIHQIEGRRINIGAPDGARALTVRTAYESLFGRTLPLAKASFAGEAPALDELLNRSTEVVVLVGNAPAPWASAWPEMMGGLRLLSLAPEHASTRRALAAGLSASRLDAGANADARTPPTSTLAMMSFLVTGEARTARVDTLAVGRAEALPDALGGVASALCRQLPALQRDGHPKWREFRPGWQPEVGWPYAAESEAALRACGADTAAPPALLPRAAPALPRAAAKTAGWVERPAARS